MSKIERFEDRIAWQKARALTKTIIPSLGTMHFQRIFGSALKFKALLCP